MSGGAHDASAPVPRLPSALSQPSAYSHDAADLLVVETHVSWIALAGPFAYKLKKPVRLDFIDYSSRERRREACNVELSLNRRWAPQLYLGLSWLTSDDGIARFVAAETPGAEPAVRMRRFDRREELDALLERDDVDARELAELGSRLAGWQSHAAAVERDAPWGGPGPALAAAVENFDTLRDPAVPFDRARLCRLERWTRATHRALANRLECRRGAGRVRECHGDLHTRNVVRLDGLLTPFDGIDFDPRLRWIDVASDAAFLAMDLERLGRPNLAYAFLDGWWSANGDYGAADVLPWFVAYRSLVRAKVASVRAMQLARGDEATAAWRECERFVALAETRIRDRTGRLYATVGVSGSGKSWLAERLVDALPAIRLRSDVERKRLAGLSPLARSGSAVGAGLYSDLATAATYESLARAAEGLLRAGFDVLVDATNLAAAQRATFTAVAAALGATVTWLDCSAPEHVLRERVVARRGDASEATVDVLFRQLASREALSPAERAHAIAVRTDGPLDVCALAAALRAAAARPAGWSAASAPGS